MPLVHYPSLRSPTDSAEEPKIHFAHTTFAWQSEASGKAHVHVVILGFGAFDVGRKTLFEYDLPKGVAPRGAREEHQPVSCGRPRRPRGEAARTHQRRPRDQLRQRR